jgi:hypothetical protein
MDLRPPIKHYVTMTQAGDNTSMNGLIGGLVELQLHMQVIQATAETYIH